MNTTLRASCLAWALLLPACAQRNGYFSVISTRNVAATWERAPERASGSACTRWLLFGLINFGEKNYNSAVESVLNRHPGYEALVDAASYTSSWSIPFLYGQDCFSVEGFPARLAVPAGSAPPRAP